MALKIWICQSPNHHIHVVEMRRHSNRFRLRWYPLKGGTIRTIDNHGEGYTLDVAKSLGETLANNPAMNTVIRRTEHGNIHDYMWTSIYLVK